MQLSAVIERLERVVAATGSPGAGLREISAALAASREVQSFLASHDAELTRMLSALPGTSPETAIAEATRCSLGEANRQRERADTLDAVEAISDALSDGAISPGHVDALTRAGRQLEAEQRAELFDQGDELADAASRSSAADFDRLLKRKVRSLQRESGEERLERQRRNSRLRTWIDGEEMFNISGRFDPATGSLLARRLREAASSIIADGVPEPAPSDPLERRRHVDALALSRLVLGSSDRLARPSSDRSRIDAVVVIDTTQSAADVGPIIDHGIPAELPFSVLQELFGVESPDVVVVANGVVLHAPGKLDLERSTRLANRAQRRALRALYATCAVPACTVHYDRCKLHHVVWWRHGGRTDLDNLLPVCQHHHTRLHDERWKVTLGPSRELTITTRGGQIMQTGPPTRRSAPGQSGAGRSTPCQSGSRQSGSRHPIPDEPVPDEPIPGRPVSGQSKAGRSRSGQGVRRTSVSLRR
jgi:hypothetical protein